MGCKCLTPNDEENREISKGNQDENIFELYQEYNLNEANNSDNYDENDIINNLIKSDIKYENENNENTKVTKNSKY